MAVGNKILLITGANTGLGYETVRALLQSGQGYHILLGSRTVEKAQRTIESLHKEFPQSNSTLEPIAVDISSDESIENAFTQVRDKGPGRIDILLNNAGASFDRDFIAGKLSLREAYNNAYNVNVAGTNVLTWTFMPLLLKSADPRLIFVAGLSHMTVSSVKYFPTPPQPAGWPKDQSSYMETIAYRCSKTALNMLMLDWAHKLKADGVKVWGAMPGVMTTNLGGFNDELVEQGGIPPSQGGAFIRKVVEGERDADDGKLIHDGGLCPF